MTEILDRHYEKLGLAPWVKPEVQHKDTDAKQHSPRGKTLSNQRHAFLSSSEVCPPQGGPSEHPL